MTSIESELGLNLPRREPQEGDVYLFICSVSLRNGESYSPRDILTVLEKLEPVRKGMCRAQFRCKTKLGVSVWTSIEGLLDFGYLAWCPDMTPKPRFDREDIF